MTPTPRVPSSTYLFLIVGLVAASQSGNLIRLGSAPALVMAAWRLVIASLVLLPVAGRGLGVLPRLSRRELALLVVASIALAGHLVSWIAAVQKTTVANAAVFFAVNPVLTTVAAHFVFGERFRLRALAAAALGMAGLIVIGRDDLSAAPGHFEGDALALLCSSLFTVYFLIGKRLRRVLTTGVLVAAVYAIAGGVCFLVAALHREHITGYDGRTWICFALLALVPTVVGHTSFNNALRYLDAGWVSTATMAEPPLAALVAVVAWGELPTAGVGVGYLVICGAVLLLVWDTRFRNQPAATS